jgi:hypothetical protein
VKGISVWLYLSLIFENFSGTAGYRILSDEEVRALRAFQLLVAVEEVSSPIDEVRIITSLLMLTSDSVFSPGVIRTLYFWRGR